MPSSSNLINIQSIKSFKAINDQLVGLQDSLRKNDLKQFILFNDAYLIVTSNIKLASATGHFDNPKFIEKFSVYFASYYFEAINKTINKGKLPTAWKILNTISHKKSTPNFILLLLGANAHINHDLALALAHVTEGEDTDELLLDVMKIDKILMDSGRDIITLFEEPNWVLDVIKRRFIFIYYRPTMYMILFWRVRAWSRYKSIKRNGLKKSNYANGSAKIAKRFLLMGKYLG